METCPHCQHPLSEDRDRLGARCPVCHEALYEPLGRMSRVSKPGEPTCGNHPGMVTVGECAKCLQPICETCRTRRHGKLMCVYCVDRALAVNPPNNPETIRYHQARRGLILSVVAWAVGLLACLGLSQIPLTGGSPAVIATFFLVVVLLSNVMLAALAVGQAMTALRVEGGHRDQAVTALVLAGAYIAIVLGLGSLALWQS